MHLALRQGMITQNGIMQQARLAIDMYFDQEPLDRDAINEELKRLALAQTPAGPGQIAFFAANQGAFGPAAFSDSQADFSPFQRQEQKPAIIF